MGEKKVRSLLKGVAITGASVGGAALLGDADLVYAMEEAAGEIVVDTTPAPTVEVTAPAPAAVEVAAPAPAAPAAVEVAPAPVAETPAPVAETPATPVEEAPVETPAAPVVEAPVETPAAPVVEAPVETPATPAEETPAALAEDTNDDVFTILRGAYRDESIDENELTENKVEPQAMRKAAPLATESTNDTETGASLSDTAEAATVYTEEQISESGASLSTVESELSSTSEQLSTSASEVESEYESYSETMTTTSEDYASKNYNIAKLDKLEQDVKSAQALEIAKRETLAAANKSLDNEYFEKICRPLAITMIKYNLVIDGKADPNFIDSAQIKYYTPDGYDKKHFCTIYLGTDGQVHEEYYDYVTANARGESLFRWSELSEEDVAAGIKIPRNISIENYSPYVSGVNIVEKFVQDNGIREGGRLYSYTFTGDDGTVKTFKITRQNYSMEADENGHYKGKDYYGYAFMNSQMDERSELASEMLSLSEAIASTSSRGEGYQSMVDEYVARSNELDSAWSEYAANSTKTAESLANSTSTAASEQASTVASQEASTAASTSASASESAAVAATVSAPAASASTSAPAASAQTVMPAASAIVNPVITPIDDARVPLGVVNDDVVGGEEVTGGGNPVIEGRTIEAVSDVETEVTQIEDDDVAKGVTVTEDQGFVKRSFWWWIIALITGKITYDKVKKEKEKEKENN